MTDEKLKKISEDEDFIDCPKMKNSVNKLIEKYPDGVDDEYIAKVLNLDSTEQVEEIYQSAIQKYRKALKVN